MPLRKVKKSEKGQILLIVVLASVISLTVGLAAISRSITNTRVSSEESNSQKALSAAEAGVEEQLNKANTGNSGSQSISTLSNNAKYAASANPIGGNNFPVNNGDFVSQDVGADVWLADHTDFEPPTSTTLTILWATSSGGCAADDAAIEVAVIYGIDKNNPSMARYAADPCNTRRAQNHFAQPGSVSTTIQGQTFNRALVLPAIAQGRIARVIPLYADTKIGVQSTAALPDQGYLIESKGTSGDTVRKVKVYQGFPRVPIEFFPYNLFLP